MKLPTTTTSVLVAMLALAPQLAMAFDVNITARDPRAVYLRVGDGVMNNGPYNRTFWFFNPPTPGEGGAVPVIRANVPANQVGSGVAVPMTTPNSPRTTSDWDNFQFCNSGQVYVGGFYRSVQDNGFRDNPARLSYSAPAFLLNGNGQSIPISRISWTTSGNGDTGAQPFGAGNFNAGSAQLTTIARNQWRETCMTFSYSNQDLVAAGTYEATVTFTLAQP